MKIALCFWGQPRFIENPAVFNGLNKVLFSNPEYNVDIYVHTWFNENGTMVGSNWSGIHHKMNPKTLDYIVNRYRNNLKHLVWMAQPNFLLDDRFKPLRQQMCDNMQSSVYMVNDINFNALCSQMVSTHEAINLIRHAGIEQYDWIILMRQDCCLFKLPDLTTLDPNKLYCALTGPESIKDDYFIFNPKNSQVFNMVDALQTYTVTNTKIPNAEHIRYVQALKFIPVENIISLNTPGNESFKVIRSYE